jgi:hypothetical protein
MKTQFDSSIRVVALSNLEAMAKRVSGTCHKFHVSRVTKTRAYVEYSNPDEYGAPRPMEAVFPAWPEFEGTVIALSILRVRGDKWDGEGRQAFQPLIDCPQLWRSSPDSDDWRTRQEIEQAKQ